MRIVASAIATSARIDSTSVALECSRRSTVASPVTPMAEWNRSLSRAASWLESLASRPLGAVVLAGLALVAYVVRALAWPLKTGTGSRRVPLRLRPALRPRRPATVVAALPDADHAALRRRLARRLRRQARGAAHGAPLRRLDRLLGGGGPVLRAVGRDRRRGLPAPLPGLRTDVPRALERAGVRGRRSPSGHCSSSGRRSRRRWSRFALVGPRRRSPCARPPG